jgi:glyoxylate reductase
VPRRPRVFATRALPAGGLARLAERADLDVWPGPGAPPPEILVQRVADAEGLLCLLTDRVDAALLARAPRLRVSELPVGLGHGSALRCHESP